MGGGILSVIVLIVFLPLLVYSLLNYIGNQSIPQTVTFTITLSGYPALYTMIAQRKYLTAFDSLQMNELDERFVNSQSAYAKSALEYLSEYDESDRLVVELRQDSLKPWEISEPSFQALKNDLSYCKNGSPGKIYLVIKIAFKRPKSRKSLEVLHNYQNTIMLNSLTCRKLHEVLDENLLNVTDIRIPNAFPPFLALPPEQEAYTPKQLYQAVVPDGALKNEGFADMILSVNGNKKLGRVWKARMNVRESDEKDEADEKNGGCKCGLGDVKCCLISPVDEENNREGMQIVTFVDKLFPSWMGSYVKGGIMAMYLAVVLFLSGMVRNYFIGNLLDTIVSELPYIDRLLKICMDIYLVREERDFCMEQDMYGKLIFLFRSPETLIKWTRPKSVKQD